MDEEECSLARVVEMHLTRLREKIEHEQRLCQRLEATLERLQSMEVVSVDKLLETIKEITMFEKYYTPEQLEELKQRKEIVGEERIQQVQQEWRELFALVRGEMEKGTDPADEPMQTLARRWQGLIDEFTGGNKEIEKSLGNMYKQEGPAIGQKYGYDFDPKLFKYAGKALAALKATS